MTKLIKEEAKQMYESGFSTVYIARRFNATDTSVCRCLHKLGVKMRRQRCVRCSVNDDYFERIDSAEKAYFLGLLATDGCVFSPRGAMKSYAVILKLKDTDEEIVRKFADVVEWKGELRYSKSVDKRRRYVRVYITSDKMASDLMRLGVGVNKTYNLGKVIVPKEFERDFWRGAIDGDGWISKSYVDEEFGVALVGTRRFLEYFKEFLIQSGVKPKANVLSRKNNFSCIYGLKGSSAIQVVRLLYNCGGISMKRKFELARRWWL